MAVYRVPVNLTWPGSGSPGVNVWSLRVSAASFDAARQDAIDELHAFYTSIIGTFAAGTKITLGDIVERDTQEYAAATWTAIDSAAGVAMAAPANQICIGWRTSLAARRGMGRTFIGPLTPAAITTDGTLNEATRVAVEDAATALVTASQTLNEWAYGVWGLETKAPPLTTDYGALPHVHRDFVSASVKDKVAILRSRRD